MKYCWKLHNPNPNIKLYTRISGRYKIQLCYVNMACKEIVDHNSLNFLCIRRVWRHQRGNHNPYIEEEQTTLWPKEKVQKDKQQKHAYKTKDRVTRTPLKTGGELRCVIFIVSFTGLTVLSPLCKNLILFNILVDVLQLDQLDCNLSCRVLIIFLHSN